MRLVLSRHAAFVPLGAGLHLCGHAFHGPRNVVDDEQRAMLDAFAAPRDRDAYLAGIDPARRALVAARLDVLIRQALLVDADADEDARLRAAFGTRVESVRDGLRHHQQREAVDPRVRPAVGPAPVVAAPRATWKVVYLGLCVVLPSMDALVQLGAAQGLAIDAVGSFPADTALVAEARPDFVVIGDLPRVGLGYRDPRPPQYARALRALIDDVRRRTAAPILVHNLPAPTCPLGGLADRGVDGAINRVRAQNLELAALADEVADVHVVDLDHAFGLVGTRGLVDDQVVVAHHLGSLSWLAERAHREPAPTALPIAAHLDALAAGPLAAEYVTAAEDLRTMRAIAGVGRRKCVVVDLDDTLWPGVLAETGAPFPPDLPVDVYPHHLYLGLHEALLALRDRGVLLACVSKNDERVVRELWRYPSTFAGLSALTLDDFATHRINWRDKVENLEEIAAELGLAPDAIAFVDDNAHERARVHARLPEVMVLGENPFAVRGVLLTDPAFQVPRPTDEARRRTAMVRGQLARERSQGEHDEASFRDGLGMTCAVRRERDGRHLPRIAELLTRTTQLNTTGRRFTTDELADLAVYALAARDRHADYGLVGACVVEGDTLAQVVLSCRVLGLGLELVLIDAVARDLWRHHGAVRGRLVATARNQPARDLFARAGFVDDGEEWRLPALASLPPLPPYAVTRDGLDA